MDLSAGIKCVVCGRHEPTDGHTTCSRCIGRLDDDLARLPELARLASEALMPRQRAGDGGHAVPGSKPPLDLAALDAALGNDVIPVLESWIRLIREEAGLVPYGVATAAHTVTVDTTVTWLRSWLLWAAERTDFPIGELSREVRDLRIVCERFDPDHDRPDGMRIPCGQPHPDADGRDCGYRIIVTAGRPADDLECRRCGHITTAGRLILVALNDPNVTVWAYPDVIEATLGIPGRTLRRWAISGQVPRNGSRYDVGASFRLRSGQTA